MRTPCSLQGFGQLDGGLAAKGYHHARRAAPCAMTPITSSGVSGSKYSRSAVSKSVETVSGLLLTITTS